VTIIVFASQDPHRPHFEVRHGDAVHRPGGQAGLRDLVRAIDAECTAAGVELLMSATG
jgi:hypothetical protein